MYTKEQAARLRQAFWTAFGNYMNPIPSSEGLKANWLNYNTGIKHVYFRMHAENKKAAIGIEITHPDLDIQELFFEQFTELRLVLHEYVNEEWEWALHTTDNYGKIISRIYKDLAPVNVFNQNDWPELISFFKPRLIALDDFWSGAQYSFDELK